MRWEKTREGSSTWGNTTAYNRICTGEISFSMGVSITLAGDKLRHPCRVNRFEFMPPVLPHLRIWFFIPLPTEETAARIGDPFDEPSVNSRR